VVSKDLIIDAGDSEVSLALLEDKQLIELNKEKRNIQFSVGDIYLGKVKKIMPGLNAAFINVGYERDAFLHYLDLGAQFRSLHRFYSVAVQKQGKVPPVSKFKPEQDIDKDGKICRYLFPSYTENHGYGILPFDFKMAVLETGQGKVSPTIARFLRFCFSYDTEGQKYALNFTRIFGAVILLFAGIFFLIIWLKPKKEIIKTR